MAKAMNLKNRICIFMAFILILSGICFVKAETYSAFDYPETGNDIRQLLDSDSVSHNEILSVEEVSAFKNVNTIAVKSARTSKERSGVRWCLILVLLAALPKILISRGVMTRLLAENSADGRQVIIRYIHQQDGLKG